MYKVLSIFAALILVFTAAFAGAADTLPLVTAEWPPYASSTLEGHGYVVEFIVAVVREMGMEPDIRFYPWARAQKAIEQAEVFGGFPFGITEQRKEAFDFSEIFLKTKTLFFYDRQNLKELKGDEVIQQLKNYRVGVIRGSKTLSMLQEAGFEKIYSVDSVDQTLHMLKTGRVQLAALVEHSGWHSIHTLLPEEIDNFGAIPFYNMEAALMISSKYPGSRDLLQKFNQALKVIEASGTMTGLLKKYNLSAP